MSVTRYTLGSRDHLANHEWVAVISGLQGCVAQQQAYHNLANYLYISLSRFFHSRQSEFAWLSSFDATELNALAEDITQTCLAKLCRDDHALLDQFTGEGTFTAWAAQIALNEARSELRRVRWSRLQPLDKFPNLATAPTSGTERTVERQDTLSALDNCLNQLSANDRIVLVRCVLNGEPAIVVAKDLKRSAQAVYNLVNRAKKKLGKLLVEADVGPDDLALFSG